MSPVSPLKEPLGPVVNEFPVRVARSEIDGCVGSSLALNQMFLYFFQKAPIRKNKDQRA